MQRPNGLSSWMHPRRARLGSFGGFGALTENDKQFITAHRHAKEAVETLYMMWKKHHGDNSPEAHEFHHWFKDVAIHNIAEMKRLWEKP